MKISVIETMQLPTYVTITYLYEFLINFFKIEIEQSKYHKIIPFRPETECETMESCFF